MLEIRRLLVSAVERMDEEKAIRLFKWGMNRGINPRHLFEEAQVGMDRVCELYDKGDYYISDLVMAAMIFQRIVGLMPKQTTNNIGDCFSDIIIGTVEGDIHDIGKNITIGIMLSREIDVFDLGVDVTPEDFVKSLQNKRPKILALGGLLTSSYVSMKKTVEAVTNAGMRDKVKIIIGGAVDEDVKNYVGADFWTNDCTSGVEICEQIVARSDSHYPFAEQEVEL